MYEADKFEVGGLTVRIVQDEDAESPREWDNLGTMVCWHRHYNLGDYTHTKQNFPTPQEFRESAAYKEAALILPLYLYDHSGISISAGSFIGRAHHAEWDSGPVGFAYISKDKLREEYSVKRITKATLSKAEKVLRGEVETYDQYLRGDVYGAVVEDAEGNTLDSCWGFFGLDYARQEGKSMAESCLASQKETDAMVAKFAL